MKKEQLLINVTLTYYNLRYI